MSSTLPVCESFYSVEGEGLFVGFPTVFLRTFGCNLRCPGFHNPKAQGISYHEDQKTFPIGCDSAYSWAPTFKNNIKRMDGQAVRDLIASHVPTALLGMSRHISLSLTGGEPMLHQKFFVQELLRDDLLPAPFNSVVVETNGTIMPEDEFLSSVENLGFSCSPKLPSTSGEPDAIKLDVLRAINACTSYFKFVSDGTDRCMSEILSVVDNAGLDGLVYLMPVGSTREQQLHYLPLVAEQCLKYGFSLSGRLHTMIWNDEIGK